MDQYRRTWTVVLTVAAIASLPVVVSNRVPDDWPQWRGPNRDGVSAERGLLKAWPAGGPPLAWKASGA
jgi:outer membrane protein assembly factor BamB